jgi:hypothetical protein
MPGMERDLEIYLDSLDEEKQPVKPVNEMTEEEIDSCNVKNYYTPNYSFMSINNLKDLYTDTLNDFKAKEEERMVQIFRPIRF